MGRFFCPKAKPQRSRLLIHIISSLVVPGLFFNSNFDTFSFTGAFLNYFSSSGSLPLLLCHSVLPVLSKPVVGGGHPRTKILLQKQVFVN